MHFNQMPVLLLGRKRFVDGSGDLAFEWEGEHAHHGVPQEPRHHVKAEHVEEPRDVERHEDWQEESRCDGAEQMEQWIGCGHKEPHEEEGGILWQENAHCRSADQGPLHRLLPKKNRSKVEW